MFVKEIGGAVLGLWPKYISADVAGIAVFLDASNRAQISTAVMELYAVLEHAKDKVRGLPVLQLASALRIAQIDAVPNWIASMKRRATLHANPHPLQCAVSVIARSQCEDPADSFGPCGHWTQQRIRLLR